MNKGGGVIFFGKRKKELSIKLKILIIVITIVFCLLSVSWCVEKTECKVISNETVESFDSNNSTKITPTEFDKKEDANTTETGIKNETDILETIPENTTQTPTESQKSKDPFYSNIHTALSDLNNKTTKNADAFANNAKVEIDSKNKKIILKSNINITKNLMFSKNCKIELNGHTIILSENAYIEISKDVSVLRRITSSTRRAAMSSATAS